MNEKLSILKNLSAATTLGKMKDILIAAGYTPSPEFALKEKETLNAKITRFIIFMLALLSISGVAYMAWIGGDISMSHGSSAAIVCGAVDAALTVFLYTRIIKGRARFFALGFEIITLLLLGYLMTGYFGKDNLKTVTESKIMADYDVANDYRSSVQSIVDQTMDVKKTAAAVKIVEEERDGKGPVYDRASTIAAMTIDSVPVISTIPPTPDFVSLSEANKYLQAQRKKLSDAIAEIKSAGNASKQQMQGISGAFQKGFDDNLSQGQAGSLSTMIGTIDAVAKAQIPDLKLSESVLTHADLKADGLQGWFGYGADIIVIFFIVILAIQKENSEDVKKVREFETKQVIADILIEEGIPYDSEKFEQSNITQAYEVMRNILTDENLMNYFKTKGLTFEQYVEFKKQYPEVARALNNTKWNFRDITKAIREDEEFLSIAQDALCIPYTNWKSIRNVIGEPEKITEMDEHVRKSFVSTLSIVQSKVRSEDKIKEFVMKFMPTYENPIGDFLKNMETAVAKLNSKQLGVLTPEFLQKVSPEVLVHLCEYTNNEDQTKFSEIVRGWREQTDEEYSEFLSNGIVHQSDFNRFMKAVIGHGGIDAINSMLTGYHNRKTEVGSVLIGTKKVVLRPDFDRIQTALSTNNSTEFQNQISEAFKAESGNIVV